ncbi:unnamed protein product [Durusdinium trenchii]|uniref:Uncharacterized protein n=1 Tax=Durusdinium trenchii TaxID=1381693 RepID=A0ABP0KAW4_9DINO
MPSGRLTGVCTVGAAPQFFAYCRMTQSKALSELNCAVASEHCYINRSLRNSDGITTEIELESRRYYGGEEASRSTSNRGTATSVIGLLEVVESDAMKNVAQLQVAEASAQVDFTKTLQDMEMERARKEKDVQHKTQAARRLGEDVQELQSDAKSIQTELSAIKFDNGLTAECFVPPESLEERSERRRAEIEGLKDALELLDAADADDVQGAAFSSLLQPQAFRLRGRRAYLQPDG